MHLMGPQLGTDITNLIETVQCASQKWTLTMPR